MIGLEAAFQWFPDKPDYEAIKLFHETMLIKAEKGIIIPFQSFYGGIHYYQQEEFLRQYKPLTPKQLKKAQDELRRRYNFENN